MKVRSGGQKASTRLEGMWHGVVEGGQCCGEK